MAAHPRLVNKQFNSPIGLYSEANIKEVLQREQQMLANGAVGIDFQNSATGKPANLQNSAVLRMLEEEENRQRYGRSGNDYIPKLPQGNKVWPPPDYEQKNQTRSSFKDVVIPGVKRVAWPPPHEGELEFSEQAAVQAQGGPQYSARAPSAGLQQNNFSAPQHQQPAAQPSYRPLRPLDLNSASSTSPLASPIVNQSPVGFRPATPSKQWAPVHSPVHTPGTNQLSAPQYQSPGHQYQPQPQYQPASNQYQPQPQYQAVSTQYQQAQPVANQYQHPPSRYQASAQQSLSHQSQTYSQQSQAFSQQNQAFAQQSQGFSQHSQPFSQSPVQQQFQPQYQQLPKQQQNAATQYQSHPQYQTQVSQPGQQKAATAQSQVQTAPRGQSARSVEPPPTTITLRQQAPVSQPPPPVYTSQPATATLKGIVQVGKKHLRGDQKWPPEDVRRRMEDEQRHQMELEQGPACKPRRQEKDYTPFFEAHALNSAYPGYKVPPGTQFYRPL